MSTVANHSIWECWGVSILRVKVTVAQPPFLSSTFRLRPTFGLPRFSMMQYQQRLHDSFRSFSLGQEKSRVLVREEQLIHRHEGPISADLTEVNNFSPRRVYHSLLKIRIQGRRIRSSCLPVASGQPLVTERPPAPNSRVRYLHLSTTFSALWKRRIETAVL
jgi:hypothetical protein